jgi:hypothetical protein
MSNDDVLALLQPLRLIVPAMALGVVIFAAIVIYLITVGGMSTTPDLANLLLATLAALAVILLVTYVIVRKLVTEWLRRSQADPGSGAVAPAAVARGFFTTTLIGAAMAEGLSLFGIVILLVTGNWLALVAPAVGLLLILLQVPTRDRFNRFASSVTGQHWD